MADRGYFGQKDWQQLQVVQKMVRDLNIPVHVVGCETIREADGLAMSSRNARLRADMRLRAGALYVAMTKAAESIRNCDRIVSGVCGGDILKEERRLLHVQASQRCIHLSRRGHQEWPARRVIGIV